MSGASFKTTWEVESTFTGGNKDPLEILIVGVDLPIEDWNADVADEARLRETLTWIGSEDGRAMKASIARFGVTDPVHVIKRRDKTLAVDGRARILLSREVNADKVAAKDRILVLVPMVPDKSNDAAFSVRILNEFRRDDPPYVKAHQAQHLRNLGKSDADIRLAFGVKYQITIDHWKDYLNLAPEMRSLVEESGSAVQLPFAVAYEIGALGPREFKRHQLALDCLINTGAVLKGEAGRKNANTVAKMIKEGKITAAPPPGSSPALLGQAPEQVEDLPPDSENGCPNDPDSTPPPASAVTDKGGAQTPPAPASSKGSTRAPRGPATASPGIVAPKISPAGVRLVCATLEAPPGSTTARTPAEEVAYAVLAVVTGKDPGGDGLARWPEVQARFAQVVRSPITAKPGEVGSCTGKGCDRGVVNGKACKVCGGSGKSKK